MRAEKLPDYDALAFELVQLEHREADLERRLVRGQDRNATFPSETSERQAATLHAELLGLRRRMNTIRAQLVPIMRVTNR